MAHLSKAPQLLRGWTRIEPIISRSVAGENDKKKIDQNEDYGATKNKNKPPNTTPPKPKSPTDPKTNKPTEKQNQAFRMAYVAAAATTAIGGLAWLVTQKPFKDVTKQDPAYSLGASSAK